MNATFVPLTVACDDESVIEAVLAEADTCDRCGLPRAQSIAPKPSDAETADALNRLGDAMKRSAGELDLFAKYDRDEDVFVAVVSTDGCGEIAGATGRTLPEAVAAARTNLGAAVRKAVIVP